MENCGLLSIIVPVYKVESYLPRCVDSILAQTVSDLELILVDDGSPDRCGAICDEYAARDSRVRVIHKENGGLSSARNAGIDIARGQWLGFVDSDDYITPDCYEKLLSCARRRNVKLVCAGRWDVSEKTVEMTPGLCPEKEETVSGMELARRIFTWDHLDSAAWDKLYRAELFSDIRYPLGRVNEDTPVTYRLGGGPLPGAGILLLPPAGQHHLFQGFGKNLPLFGAHPADSPKLPGTVSRAGCPGPFYEHSGTCP